MDEHVRPSVEVRGFDFIRVGASPTLECKLDAFSRRISNGIL